SALFFTHHYRPLRSTLFPYTTLFRSCGCPSIREKMICTLRPFKGCRVLESMIRTRISVHITLQLLQQNAVGCSVDTLLSWPRLVDRKSTRLNSSHVAISYAVFCLKKK